MTIPLRACLKIITGAAARDFGCGRGGEGPSRTGHRASPKRAVRTEPTKDTAKRAAARRVFAEKAFWLCCSSVEDPPGIFSFVAPRHTASSAKTASFIIFRQALRTNSSIPSSPTPDFPNTPAPSPEFPVQTDAPVSSPAPAESCPHQSHNAGRAPADPSQT